MLNLILGHTGTGKTTEIIKQLDSVLNEELGSSCLLIVPEQITFETEKEVILGLGVQNANRVKVCSFTKFACDILEDYGGGVGTVVDDSTRALLLSEAMEETSNRRDSSKKYESRDKGQMQSIMTMMTELKQNAITVEDLNAIAGQIEKKSLKTKLKDLAVLIAAYEALVSQKYVDADDILTQAISILGDLDLSHYVVFFDGFTGFTAQQLKMVSLFMEKSFSVTVSLSADSYDAVDLSDVSPFYIPQKTAHQLVEIAHKKQIPISAPIHLYENYRFCSKELKAIEESLFDYSHTPCELEEGEKSAVTVIQNQSIYEECRNASKMIHRFVREGGHYKDVVVVARNLGDYDGILDSVFEQEGIPFFMDVRQNILTDSLIETVMMALRAVCDNWRSESMIRLMKTGLLGFSPKSISLMENYVYIWDLKGSDWEKEWTARTDGFQTGNSEKERHHIDYLNRLRMRLLKPLLRLKGALSRPVDGKGFAKAVLNYLLEVHADRLLSLQVKRLEKIGDYVWADRTSRMWDCLMDILDIFASSIMSLQSARRYYELFHLICYFIDMGAVPQLMESVQIGQADRVRYAKPKMVIMLGVNEGIFPASPVKRGFFNDRERTRLIENGLNLMKTTEYSIAEEEYFAYSAVTAPSDYLIVSYIACKSENDMLDKSEVVKAVEEIAVGHNFVDKYISSIDDIETLSDAIEFAALNGCETELSSTVTAALSRIPGQKNRLEQLRKNSEKKEYSIDDEQIAQDLFKLNAVSPSRIERYYNCPYMYFCDYGLNVHERKKADLDSIQVGNVVHEVLEKLVNRYNKIGFGNVTYEMVQEDSRLEIDSYVANNLGGIENKPYRFKYLLTRLEQLASDTLWFVLREMSHSKFVPVDYELEIGVSKTSQVNPLKIALDDGSFIQLVGKVDRVDVLEQNGKKFIRIVDYKTGKKEFSLSDAIEGRNLQMLVYLFTLLANGTDRYGDVVPAGVLYLPTKLGTVKEEECNDGNDHRINNKRMNGILLDDPSVLNALEIGEKGLYIPCDKNGKITLDLATLEQFDLLSFKSQKLVKEMVQSLHRGRISDNPSEEDPCRYCSYTTICRREPIVGDPLEKNSMDSETIYNQIREEKQMEDM